MKMMIYAAMMLMNAVPAVAQEVDPDAICQTAMATTFGLSQDSARLSPERKAERAMLYSNATAFFSGVLVGRYSDAELPAVLIAGDKEFEAMSPREAADTAKKCLRSFLERFKKVTVDYYPAK
jgi:hypothetical protein